MASVSTSIFRDEDGFPTLTSITTLSSVAQGSTTVIVISSTSATTTYVPLMPLTTTFVPPSSCFNRFYYDHSNSDSRTITSDLLDPTFEDCQAYSLNNLTYSPGMCPGRMTTVRQTFSDSKFTELCCQSGFTYDPRGCGSVVPDVTIVPIYPTILNIYGSPAKATLTSVEAVHEAVTIIWAPSDIPLFPSDVASNHSALFANTTANSNARAELTQTAKIGVGVGVTVGIMIILIIVSAWLIKLRRRKRQLSGHGRNGAGELDGEQKIWKRFFGHEWRAELPPDGPPAELATEPAKTAELASPQVPVELPGSYHYPEPAKKASEDADLRGSPSLGGREAS